jgi:hypothetical protein
MMKRLRNTLASSLPFCAAIIATVLRPVREQFHGERSGLIADPFGHR